MDKRLSASEILPADPKAVLIGRVWSNAAGGPCPVLIENGQVKDLSKIAATVSGLLEMDLTGAVAKDRASLPVIGSIDDFLDFGGNKGKAGELLAPCDLQAVKAAGVTFAGSMVERVIEERAKGEPEKADAIRKELAPIVGESLRGIRPGSEQAAEVKKLLQARGLWSQYLEVGIGPDAEIFTKAQPMSSVGCGADVGINPISTWNNPEPEVVLAINSKGRIVGATLGNDVNLRDVEGRSALLLGKAKDNNAACAIGPFVRLFDDSFSLADVEQLELAMSIKGRDGFELAGESRMSAISRPPADIAGQAIGPNHQYPDGFFLFLGTMFAPVKDRKAPGQGFTHDIGDEVRISTKALGTLVNWVDRSDRLPPWTFGTRALMENLARRGLL
ncbi:MAG TPA: fumarylacetoacetate hydrolase family protein [Rhizobiaceae bacterium]|nr:fumarylacetoacetate hydrolase family protein [Rhizobiaceae bacterium]